MKFEYVQGDIVIGVRMECWNRSSIFLTLTPDHSCAMTFADKILQFNQSLRFDKTLLPLGVEVMNPFGYVDVQRLTSEFYRKFFSDKEERFMIIGINPGRFGGGVTGIPFTDPHKLLEICDVAVGKLSPAEMSSDFIYAMIDAYGGPQKFYGKFFLTAVCPLGFTIRKNGKEVNYNYYDSKELLAASNDFILETLRQQLDFGIRREVCFCLGAGKNFDYLSALNATHHFFQEIVALDHPRFIMQYRRKKINEYIDKYLKAFSAV